MSNEATFETPVKKTFAGIQEAQRSNGVALAPNGTGDFAASEEFARFVQHAKKLEREGEPLDTLKAWLDLAEAWRITQALRACKGNRSAAARMLGIGRRTLYSKMEKLGITPTWSV